MARPKHYQPVISRALICALYHEGKRRRLPMTQLIEKLFSHALAGTPGWDKAIEQYPRAMPTLKTEPVILDPVH